MEVLKNLFNWLSNYPRHQYTLGELVDAFKSTSLDYQIAGEDGYAPFNRAGRLLERTITIGSAIGAGVAVSTGGLGYVGATAVVVAGKSIGAGVGFLVATYTSPM